MKNGGAKVVQLFLHFDAFLHAFNDTRVPRFAGVGEKAPRAQRHTAAQVKAA